MFYFSVENGIQCPDYITEKMWGALSRGSIPVYYGWDGIEEYLPSKDAFIDLRDYPTPETLATKLRHVATDDDAYNQMHAWRYQDPNTWPLAFRNLIREVSDDMKGSICNVLKAGPSPNHPRAKVQGFCADGSIALSRGVSRRNWLGNGPFVRQKSWFLPILVEVGTRSSRRNCNWRLATVHGEDMRRVERKMLPFER